MNPDLSNDPLPDYLRMFAAQLGITTTNPECIRTAIADLRTRVEANTETNELIAAIAVELNLSGEFESADVLQQVKELRLTRDTALICARNKNSSLEAISAQLGIKYNGETEEIHEAIAKLKNQNLGYENIIRQTEFALKIKEDSFSYVDGCGFISTLVSFRENILKALNISPSYYVTNDQGSALEAIANLKHSLQLSQNEVKELQEKVAIPDSWKSEPITYFRSILDKLCDRLSLHKANGYELLDSCVSKLVDEVCEVKDLRSERDYYRGILDKLCDRGNFASIEALEKFVGGEIYSPFTITDQLNYGRLRDELAQSQATSLKYMNRIVELENEVRSLREPVPTTAVFLSTSELIQIIRSLLK